jgi:hypothetical protein
MLEKNVLVRRNGRKKDEVGGGWSKYIVGNGNSPIVTVLVQSRNLNRGFESCLDWGKNRLL